MFNAWSGKCHMPRGEAKKGGAGILVGMWMLESTEFLHVPWEATPHVTRERVAIHRHRANVSGRN